MAIYSGHTGRVVLVAADLRSYNLAANKFLLTCKAIEEDVTTAQLNLAAIGRAFVASDLPRIDVQIDGFWTSLNNPFGSPDPLAIGSNYSFLLYFDKDNPVPSINATILILGCEILSSVRDVVRYTVTGVIQGSLQSVDAILFPDDSPLFLPFQ